MLPTSFWGKKNINKNDLPGFLWTSLAFCFVLAMVYQPKIVFQGATSGLNAWWQIVFPSLLPFFIASEILIKLGFVRFIGVLLEPIMRPLFNVPGAGGFVMVIGFTSGFPIGSMVTAQLRQQGIFTKIEAERLISFTNNSSPLFMLTAVSVGMFGKPELGIIIAGSHYLANICLGLCLRFYKRKASKYMHTTYSNSWSLKQAFKVLLQHQRQEKQSLGKLLGDAVSSSVNKLINIGGFIILFSVIIRLFNEAGILDFLASCLALILFPYNFSPDILTALASGFFEMTNGTKIASEAAANELQRLMAVGMILGWSGLSIHAQVASMISKTDISMKLFVITRVAHALLASIFTLLLYNPEKMTNLTTIPVIAPKLTSIQYSTFSIIIDSMGLMFSMLTILIFISLIYQIILFFLKFFIKVL